MAPDKEKSFQTKLNPELIPTENNFVGGEVFVAPGQQVDTQITEPAITPIDPTVFAQEPADVAPITNNRQFGNNAEASYQYLEQMADTGEVSPHDLVANLNTVRGAA